jgi:chromosome segregation ATPase
LFIPVPLKDSVMQYLAQVQKKESSHGVELRLIARQYSEYGWTLMPDQEVIPLDGDRSFGEGALLLVKLSETRQVLQATNARDWLLKIMQTFLSSGITPEFLRNEAERAEQWRQDLTLKSQDLDRRALELEARREQIEQLEESLKREKKQMENLAVQYKEQNQALDRREMELNAYQEELSRLAAELKLEKQQLEELLRQHGNSPK